MKRFLVLLVLFCSFYAVQGAEAAVDIFPPTVFAGERVEYTITTAGEISDPVLPEVSGARWRKNERMQGSLSINFKTSYTNTFVLVPEKAGELIIPAWEVRTSKGTVTVPEQKITVQAAGERNVSGDSSGAITLAEAAQGEIVLAEPREHFYTGEEIPIQVRVLLNAKVPFRLEEYPMLSGGQNLIFRNYQTRQGNLQFGRIQESVIQKDGKNYRQLIFPAAVKSTVSGKLELSGSLLLGISEARQKRSRRDPFFDSFFDGFESVRVRPVKLELAPLKPVSILPLPSAPEGSFFTGLIGNWAVQFGIDRKDIRVGEPVTLTVSAVGTGSVEGISAPRLTLPDVRVYPPEISRSESGSMRKIEFRYALIPLKAGRLEPHCSFTVFDTLEGKYRSYQPDMVLTVEPPLIQSSGAAVFEPSVSAAEKTAVAAEKTPDVPREKLFYQRSEVGKVVKLPLWQNKLVPFILLFAAAAGGLLYVWGSKKKQESRKDVRKKEFCRIRQELNVHMDHAEEIQRILRSDVTAYLMPGGSPAELAETMDDPELKRLFEECGNSGFMPGQNAGGVKLSSALLKKLLKVMKAALLIMAAVLPLYGDEFNADFDRGEYDKAIEKYSKHVSPYSISINMLYNLGGVFYQKGDLPMARYCFLKALRLDPGDHEVKANLELVNRKLLQEEEPHGVLYELCHSLRPDDYMLLAAVAAAGLFLTGLFRKKLGKIAVLWITAGCILLLTASGTLLVVQYTTTYSPRFGVLIGKEIPLKSLPADGSGHVEATLPGGSDAWIIEERGKWLRIRANGKEGWIERSGIKKLDL